MRQVTDRMSHVIHRHLKGTSIDMTMCEMAVERGRLKDKGFCIQSLF